MQDRQAPVRLNSWKSIAAFLERDERTCQRWEKMRRLPIHRVPGQRGSVFAYPNELLAWLHQTAQQDVAGESSSPEAAEPVTGAATLTIAAVAQDEQVWDQASRSLPLRSDAGVVWRSAAGLCALTLLVVGGLALGKGQKRRLPSAPANAVAAPLPSPQTVPPDSPVHELYLSGRFALEQRTPESLHTALLAFGQATRQDPTNAAAFVGLAETYDLLPEFSGAPLEDVFPRGLEAARMAVRLAPGSPDAHRVLAFGLFYWEWKTDAALQEFERSLRLDPRNAHTHQWYANALMAVRHLPEAQREINLARELNPTSESIVADEALIMGTAGHQDVALTTLDELERNDPGFHSSINYRLTLLFFSGRNQDYMTALHAAADRTHEPALQRMAAATEQGWRVGGERGMLQAMRTLQEQQLERKQTSAFALVSTCLRLGDVTAAERYFEQAYKQHDFQVVVFLSDGSSASLRGEPTFERIRQTVLTSMMLTST